MTTLNLQVEANLDDAQEADDGSGFSNSVNTAKMSSNTVAASRWNSGYRFTPIPIQVGARIDSATLQVYVDSLSVDDPNIDIHAEDEDNPGNFSNPADVTSRIRTTASTAWVATSIGANFKTSPEIKTVIQEVINRAGWAQSNSLVVLADGKDDSNFSFTGRAHDFDPTSAAKLDIDFTPPTAGRTASARGVMRGVRRGVM